MSQSADFMEMTEEDIRKHYAAAVAMLEGVDHTPRIAKAKEARDAGTIPKLRVEDHMSAEVVDELIRQGTLHSIQDADDLKNAGENSLRPDRKLVGW